MARGTIEIQGTKGIKAPVKMKMDVNSEKIYWNIRFNIPLNPESVNENNMDVTDVEGFILTSNIGYNSENNAIVISPREPYKPNATYILNISTEVCSKGNNNLKEEVQIIFKLIGSEISSFKVLKGKERIDIDIKPSKYAPTSAQIQKDKLPVVGLHINFWVALGSLIVFGIAVATKILIAAIIGTVIVLAGMAHLVYQYINKNAASIKAYNKGAECYNNQEYGDASEHFNLALAFDSNNQLAQKGVARVANRSAYTRSIK